MLWGRAGRAELAGMRSCLVPTTPRTQDTPGLTNVLEVQVVIEKLILLEVRVLGGVDVVLNVILDLADGVHQDGVIVQHAQDGLQHAHMVAVLLNVPLQALYPVLLLLASPGPGSGAAGRRLTLLPHRTRPQSPTPVETRGSTRAPPSAGSMQSAHPEPSGTPQLPSDTPISLERTWKSLCLPTTCGPCVCLI